jgi:hypothetical protein
VFDTLSPDNLRVARTAIRLLYLHRSALGLDTIAPKLDSLSADITAELETRDEPAPAARQAP